MQSWDVGGLAAERYLGRWTCDGEVVGSTPGQVAVCKWLLVTTWMGDCLRTGKPLLVCATTADILCGRPLEV